MSDDEQDFVLLNAVDVQGFNEKGLLPLSDAELKGVRSWLAPTDYAAASSEYGKHLSSRSPGTGAWIVESNEYRQWYAGERSALWIKAIAGAGKSVIAASIVSRLIAEGNAPVLYFFFRHIVSANQRPISLMRDFMAQLLDHSPTLQHRLHTLIKDRGTPDCVSTGDMWEMLVASLEQIPTVYCIVDALDEMDKEDDHFLANLLGLAQRRSTSIKLLLTSRPIPRVETVLRNPAITQITLQSHLIDPDISKYVRHRLETSSLSVVARENVHRVMCSKSSGQFLYARLMMDDLLDPTKNITLTDEDLSSSLESLPQPMAGMYTQMLLDHSRRSGVTQELQLSLLQWVTRAERPVRLLELAAVVGITHTTLAAPKGTKDIVRHGCGPLLEILEDETVCPIHHSLTEYLYDQQRLPDPNSSSTFPALDYHQAQRMLALTCLTYLCSGWHHSWHKLDPLEDSKPGNAQNEQLRRRDLRLKFPLLEYAANNWYKHVRKSELSDQILIQSIDKLLVDDQQLRSAWLEMITEPRQDRLRPSQHNMTGWLPLQIAADKGLPFYIAHLIRQGENLECLSNAGLTPLALAACAGHAQSVTVLLEHSAKNNEANNVGLTPLHHAASRGHHQVVKVLLEAGVDPLTPKTKEDPGMRCGNARRTYGDTPVRYACCNGHLETVKTFIPYLSGDDLADALGLSLEWGHSETALAVLKVPGLDVNGKENRIAPLFGACNARDLKVMRRLLEMGARVDKASDTGHLLTRRHEDRSLLQAFLQPSNAYRHQQTANADDLVEGVKMLLDAGENPNFKGPDGKTVLHHAVGRGGWPTSIGTGRPETHQILILLLENGADAKALTNDGSNILHFASDLTTSSVDALIDHGVDINLARRKDGKTPLMTLIDKRDLPMVKYLLKRGADVNIPDTTGNMPLHAVALSSFGRVDFEMVTTLLQAGANIESRNKAGNTILHLGQPNSELLAFAVEHGCSLEAKNKRGRSVLHHAVSQWYNRDNVCRMLKGTGADVHTKDSNGANLLHTLTSRGSDKHEREMMLYCVEHGVNPLEADAHGETLWHKYARRNTINRQEEDAELLALFSQWKLSEMVQDNQGTSPLHVAASIDTQRDLICHLVETAGVSVDVATYDMVRPIHLAASWNVELSGLLIVLGANLMAATLEGQTALMIACRNGQCDIVGMLLHYYRNQEQLGIVNYADVEGRTALHYACRSGIPEVVDMLLQAGADPDVKDSSSYTPLRLCADCEIEAPRTDPSMRNSTPTLDPDKWSKAGNIALADDRKAGPNASLENPRRVRESIRLLIEHGARLTHHMTETAWYRASLYELPLMAALYLNRTAMVSEMLIGIDNVLNEDSATSEGIINRQTSAESSHAQDCQQVKQRCKREMENFGIQTKTYMHALESLPAMVADNIGGYDNGLFFLKNLLEDDNEPGIIEASKLGVDFMKLDNGGDCVLYKMIQYGFTDLVRQVGRDAARMSIAWIHEMGPQNYNWGPDRLRSSLFVALNRKVPSLKMVKLLVLELKIDIHEEYLTSSYENITQSYIHLLARPQYWWQTDALGFLLEQGADVNRHNSTGDTPLMLSLKDTHGPHCSIVRKRAITVLLEHGADPNILNDSGQTCLNVAAQCPELIMMLLTHGANPAYGSRPFLFDVIKNKDINLLESIVKLDIDVNVLATPTKEKKMPANRKNFYDDSDDEFAPRPVKPTSLKPWIEISNIDELMARAYPLHVAAQHFETKMSAKDLETADHMIELLLKAGADLAKTYDDGMPIMHILAQHGQIAKPLLEHPSFNAEARDSFGRTILLAACDCRSHLNGHGKGTLPSYLLEHGAVSEARDFKGRNALHCLIDACQSWYSLATIPEQLELAMSALVIQTDQEGRTPFHYALEHKRFELIDQFIQHGADFLTPEPVTKQTALHYLAADLANEDDMLLNNRKEVGNAIQRHRYVTSFPMFSNNSTASSNTEDEDINALTPEEVAKAESRSPRRSLLSILDRGLTINARDLKGETPLFKLMTTPFYRYDSLPSVAAPPEEDASEVTPPLSTQQSNILLRLFASLNADFHARSSTGESILHRLATVVVPKPSIHTRWSMADNPAATSAKLKQAFGWLVGEHGLNVGWEDDEGRTCLDVAAAVGAEWVLEMFKREK